jgi:hypothetical protein
VGDCAFARRPFAPIGPRLQDSDPFPTDALLRIVYLLVSDTLSSPMDFGPVRGRNRRDGGTVATSWTPALILLGGGFFSFPPVRVDADPPPPASLSTDAAGPLPVRADQGRCLFRRVSSFDPSADLRAASHTTEMSVITIIEGAVFKDIEGSTGRRMSHAPASVSA